MTQMCGSSDNRDMRSKQAASLSTAAGFVLLLGGCPSGDHAGPSRQQATAGPTSSLVYERTQYFHGLDEWVLIHKDPVSYWCQRADGHRQDCEAVKAEDVAAAYRKWGAMMKPFGPTILAAAPDDIFDAHVTFRVPDVPDSPEAQEKFSKEVLAKADYWQSWVAQRGGTILTPTIRLMPEFTMRGPARLYRSLAWEPGILRIRGRVKATGRYAGSGPTDSVVFGESDQAFSVLPASVRERVRCAR